MNKAQAITAIDSALKQAAKSGAYRLSVIHGFNSGTVLRDAVRKRYKSHPLVKRIELGLNQGQTDLVLREL